MDLTSSVVLSFGLECQIATEQMEPIDRSDINVS